jgi:CoA:oxalate CoA-transferase
MDMPRLADDPRFSTARARRDNSEALKQIIEEWLAQFASRDAALQALEQQRVPCAPVLSLPEATAHPHLRERGTVRRVKDRLIGEFDIPGPPAKFSQWPDWTAVEADLLGERNEQVLRELLLLTDAEIAGLYAEKVLVRDPLLDSLAADLHDGRETIAD